MSAPAVFVTGLSGAGKASALRVLEDLGFQAIDNPPLDLVDSLVGGERGPVAIGLDARSRGFDTGDVLRTLDRLRADPCCDAHLIYLTADPRVLMRRFTETRRRHPLAPDGRVADGIQQETALLHPLLDAADWIIDTSDLPLPALRQRIEQRFGADPSVGPPMAVTLMSFAFPAGLPLDADMVFDARFLRNPHYDPILRPYTGRDPQVAAYIEADPDFGRFFDAIAGLVTMILPRFVQEGKKYVTIAVGCTGGRHRSVLIVERLSALVANAGAPAAGSPAGGSPAPGLRDGERLGHGGGRAWLVTTMHRELAAAPPAPALRKV